MREDDDFLEALKRDQPEGGYFRSAHSATHTTPQRAGREDAVGSWVDQDIYTTLQKADDYYA